MKQESRTKRWARLTALADEAISELVDVQQEYREWRDGIPENLEESPVVEKLDAVLEFELEEMQSQIQDMVMAELPLGFGRD